MKRNWRAPRRMNGGKSAAWHKSQQWTFDRASGRCEARVDRECTGRAEHAHHIQLRSRGGSDDPSNLMATCHRCHAWIHGHPAAATERGWMRASWDNEASDDPGLFGLGADWGDRR